MKTLTDKDNGGSIEIELGSVFHVVLPNPGSGGYLFQETPEFNPAVLVLEKVEKATPSESDREGDFGQYKWTLRAQKEGASPLVLYIYRPWEKDKAPIVFFEATINVVS